MSKIHTSLPIGHPIVKAMCIIENVASAVSRAEAIPPHECEDRSICTEHCLPWLDRFLERLDEAYELLDGHTNEVFAWKGQSPGERENLARNVALERYEEVWQFASDRAHTLFDHAAASGQ